MARVWTMPDVYKYQIASEASYSGLYNLAWAQAVNNKPLGDVFLMMEDGLNDSGKANNDNSAIMPSSNINQNKMEDDSEKKEGEIDLDSELVLENKDSNAEINNELRGDVNDQSDDHKGCRSLPLLDLHKDHDYDSLPSPTPFLSAPLPFDKRFSIDTGLYETDAVRAVSSYQQKFGGGLFFMDDKLPSPTPSEKDHGHAIGDGETSGEVSSSIRNKVNPAAVQPVVSSTTEIRNCRIVSSANSSRKSTAKSRDPRLRLSNLNASDESKSGLVFDRPAPKRQRTELSVTSQTEKLPVKNSNAAASLHSLLRDIAVNPSKWTEILNMENQKTSDNIKNIQLKSGKARMKPRDPRRILHNSASFRSALISSSLNTSRHEDHLEKKLVSSNGANAPDITMQSTNNLRNIADILSLSQASMPPTPRPMNANTWSDVEHLFDGFDDQQKAAIQKERARRLNEQKEMFAARKLCLVLDLDHTLLNSARFVEVDPVHNEMLRKKEKYDREKTHRHLFRFPHLGMWTKLRPGIWNFLEKASKLYELHLYTMGNKYYATEMAKLLDPRGELFSGRVIARGDDDGIGEPFDSKDLEGVLGMESAVVIIDDTVKVWPHNKANLIVAERYIYFPCSRRQFGLSGPSLLEIDRDERLGDGTLVSLLAVIERIHKNFFQHESLDEADVRNILACEQRKILDGCRIVFSRVFPVGEAKPHMHPLWRAAEQFGAVCVNQIDEEVTHVVANSLGTGKVNWALSTGKFVVRPGWVEASTLLYRRANEQDFAIKQ